MGGRGLRAREREQRATEILEAALDLFERKGYEDTTIEDIARAADVSPRTFFRYFETKAELVLMDEPDEEGHLVDQVTTRPATESPLDAIHAVAAGMIRDTLAADDGLTLRRCRIAFSTPSLRPLFAEGFQHFRLGAAAAFALRLGVPATDLVPRVLGAACAEALWNVMEDWVAEGSGTDRLLEMVDEAFDALRTGFR